MATNIVDAARVELLLNGLRLSSIRLMWAKLAEQSDKEGWPAARFRAVLAGHEMADRPPPLRAASHRGAAARRRGSPPSIRQSTGIGRDHSGAPLHAFRSALVSGRLHRRSSKQQKCSPDERSDIRGFRIVSITHICARAAACSSRLGGRSQRREIVGRAGDIKQALDRDSRA